MFRVAAGAGIGQTIEGVSFLALGGNCNTDMPVAELTASQMIEAEIGDDAVNPGVERRLKTKAIEVLVGPEKCFLIDVLSILLGTGEMKRQTQHSLIVIPHQLFERGSIPVLRSNDEFTIIDVSRGLLFGESGTISRDEADWGS